MPLFFFTVEQQERAIVERFGKFVRVAGPGLQRKSPFVERRAGSMSLQVEQLNTDIETKTKDNVFVVVKLAHRTLSVTSACAKTPAIPGSGSYTTYVYAFVVFSLPHAVVAVSVITALLPRMSRQTTGRFAPSTSSFQTASS